MLTGSTNPELRVRGAVGIGRCDHSPAHVQDGRERQPASVQRRVGRAAPADPLVMDPTSTVIDLTDAALARHRQEAAADPGCGRCGTGAFLYRLVGTAASLCEECFCAVHAS